MCHNTFCLEILIEFFTFFVYKYCPFLPFEENDSRTNKTRVLLCKRLSRQCRDVWWYTFTCTGDGGLYCAVLGGFNCYLSVYSVIFGMVTTEHPTNQVILKQACSWPVWRGSLLQSGWGIFWPYMVCVQHRMCLQSNKSWRRRRKYLVADADYT